MNKKLSLLLACIIIINSFFAVGINAYANEKLDFTTQEIEQIVEEETMNVFDDVLNSTSEMYFVNSCGELSLNENAAKSIVENAVDDVIIEENDINISDETTDDLNESFYKSISNMYTDLLEYYNDLIEKGELCVTPNGTLYDPNDNTSYVQGGNVNVLVRKVGVYYHFYNKNNSVKQANKYKAGANKAAGFYNEHKNDKNWRMSDSQYEDIMTGFGDEFENNYFKDLVIFAKEYSVVFTKNKMNRDNNVASQITKKNKKGYGTIVRINAARTIKVAAQTSNMTKENAKNKYDTVSYAGPYKLITLD